MRKLAVVLVVAAVLAVGLTSVPTQANPLLWMIGLRLIDKLVEHKTADTVSDAGLALSGHLFVDGRQVACAFNMAQTPVIIGRAEGHNVVLCLSPDLNIKPGLTAGIEKVTVSSNLFNRIEFTREDAIATAAERRVGNEPRPRRYRRYAAENKPPSNPELSWLVPINVNAMSFGGYQATVDVFFRNGKGGDSLRNVIWIFVTDVAEIQSGVNSPAIQQILRQLGGMWSPIPALGTTDIPITGEMARQNGMEDQAVAAGIPRNGTTEVTRSQAKGVRMYADDSQDQTLQNSPPQPQPQLIQPAVRPQPQPTPPATQQGPSEPASPQGLPPATRAIMARAARLMMGTVPEDILAKRQFTITDVTSLTGKPYKEGAVLVVFFLDEEENIIQPNFTIELSGQLCEYSKREQANEWGGYLFYTDYTGGTIGVNPGSSVRLFVRGKCVFQTQMPAEVGQGLWVPIQKH